MNLWGFEPRMSPTWRRRSPASTPPGRAGRSCSCRRWSTSFVGRGEDRVQVVGTSARCLGVTHQEDLALVRSELRSGPSLTAEGR